MSDSDNEVLALSMQEEYVSATMSLYDGRLVKTDTELVFIAERFSGWEIMEQCELADVQKVEVKDSFMGKVVEIHTTGSHWSLKEVPDGVDIEQWMKGKATQSKRTAQNEEIDIGLESAQPDVTLKTNNELIEPLPSSPSVTPIPKPEPDLVQQPISSLQSVHSQSTNPQVNELRQLLIERPELQEKIHQAVGKHVDPLDEDVLSLFMRRHIQSYLQVRAASGEVLSPFETLRVIQAQVEANPGGPLIVKLIKGFIVTWVLVFILPIVFGILSALFSIISILF